MIRRLVGMLLVLALLLPQCAFAEAAGQAELKPEDMVFTDYEMGYHLKDFLSGYNVLAFGNAHLGLHAMGALLVQGEYAGTGSNSGFADGQNLPPSFIKGLITAPNSVYNSRNSSTNAPLYVGSGNTVEKTVQNGETYYTVNGLRTGNNSRTPAYVNDDFFKFDEALAVIRKDQETMASRATRTATHEYGTITINVGENVTIASLENVHTINIVGDEEELVNTTINVTVGGDITMPMMNINGTQPQVKEQDAQGTSIVWNFTNAQSVKLPTMNWVGHVIAPQANVSQDSGNYNGCIVCKNLYSNAEGHVYSYNIDLTSWDVLFSLEKVWRDGGDADGLRPDSIQVQLLANGKETGKPVTLTAKENWYHVWDDLAQLDAQGKPITYSVKEINVPRGYTSEYDGKTQTLINTHEPELIAISGTKTWTGEGAFGSRLRPMYITLNLYADGAKVDSQIIAVESGASQTYTFSDLPKYKNGQEIKYFVHEETVPGYIASTAEDGVSLTNTWGGEATEVSGEKTWNDMNDADGLRPASTIVELLADGKAIDEHVISAANGWKYAFTNLPLKDGAGRQISYTVREKEVPAGYTVSYSGSNITNTHEPTRISKSGSKTWVDNNNADGLRPASIKIALYADGAHVEDKIVTPDANGNWSWTFDNLFKNNAGREIRYRVEEVDVPAGYKATVTDEMNITNTQVVKKVTGVKQWSDVNNQDGKRPARVSILLYANGEKVDERTTTAERGWTFAFEHLPIYDEQGAEIAYTIEEVPVDGYTLGMDKSSTGKNDAYVLTNTHAPETVCVTGEKIWNDSSNYAGRRPAQVTITLYADGAKVDERKVTADASGKWSFAFENLPKYKDGKQIVYTITEDTHESYSVEIHRTVMNETLAGHNHDRYHYTVTNTYNTETTVVAGSKRWMDEDNQDGLRPASITIHLLADGTQVDSAVITPDAKGEWKWSFANLPMYQGGKQITYTITEEPVAGYTSQVSGYNVINTHVPEKTEVKGQKTWNDQDNQSALRPESITIRLLANGTEVKHSVTTAAREWKWHFIDLPKYENGQEIVYTITEDPVPGYTEQVNGYNVTNTLLVKKVSGEKRWSDVNNQDGKRPARVSILLYANGEKVDERTTTAERGWTFEFANLPVYDQAGREIAYVIDEVVPEGYTRTIEEQSAAGSQDDRYIVTNTHVPETVCVTGEKVWNDNNNQDGKRPAQVTITLYADGTKADEREVTADASGKWSFAFENLPKYKDGKQIVYTITEDTHESYSVEIHRTVTNETLAGHNHDRYHYTVTNTYDTEKTAVSGSKRWMDEDNQDGIRPASITINLLADGAKVDSAVITPDAKGEWKWSFANLPMYQGGKQITYTITEDPVAGYTSQVSGYNVINTHEPEKTEVQGQKTWSDNNNQSGLRPESITIRLLANGTEVKHSVTTAAREWKWHFVDLPKYENGKEIVYTISEDPVPGYTAQVNGYNVTNTLGVTKITGIKSWNDENNQDGLRPARVTIILKANGQAVAERTTTAERGWSYEFANLPVYDGTGKAVTYTIAEAEVAGYQSEVNGYNVTNTHQPETVCVTGEKVWNDNNNQDGKRPAQVTITLYADGTKAGEKVVKPEASGKWSFAFENLPKYKDGKRIVYSITEDVHEGYLAEIQRTEMKETIDGHHHDRYHYIVTNNYRTETTVVAGSKRWMDNENQDGKRPVSITINLLADGAKVDSAIITPDAKGEWKWSFANLPAYQDGKLITYTITEDPIEGYSSQVSGYNVINTRTPETTEVKGEKTWNDKDNQDGIRPESITIRLLANGTEVKHSVTTAARKWAWHFVNLPKYENGKEIVYTITEDAVDGYTTQVNGYNVTNTHAPETLTLTGSKTWDDNNNQDGVRPVYVIIRLYDKDDVDAYGNRTKVIDYQYLSDMAGWTYEFSNLPKYKVVDGETREIEYEIVESPVAGYTPVYTPTANGVDVKNVHRPDMVEVEGAKIWNDEDNLYGVRPAQITVRLYADNREIGVKTVKPDAFGVWSWNFGQYPKYENGREIVYTVKEDAVVHYEAEYISNSFDIRNTVTGLLSVTAHKVWQDDNNRAGLRPQSITVHLLRNGEVIDSKAVTAAEQWTCTFANLPSILHGVHCVYTLAEEPVVGYAASIEGSTITNTFIMTDFTVTKAWEGREGGAIGLTLYAGEEAVAPQPAYERNGSVYTYRGLRKVDEAGNEIVYSVVEKPMEGYAARYQNTGAHAAVTDRAMNGGTIINREMTDISVRKVWQGTDDGAKRPAITLTLYCNGEKVDCVQPAPDKNGWYTYAALPAFVGGREAVYTVKETPVNGFITTYVNENGATDAAYDGGTIYNTALPETGDSSSIARYAALLLASLAGMALLLRRRKQA